MQIVADNFADMYCVLIDEIQKYPTNIACRGLNICYELINVECRTTKNQKVYWFSNMASRTVPVRFVLAEFLWIISASNDLHSIARFNHRMVQYSDDRFVLNGAYGFRLQGQIENAIALMLSDKYTRQAVCTIFHPKDGLQHGKSKDIPCNIVLQFLIRNDVNGIERLNLRIISRSSDFVTGYSIDMIHWQMLQQIICNSLHSKYNQLLCGDIVYHIGSLHMYDIDKSIVRNWKTDCEYSHDFHMRDTYESLKAKAQTIFSEAETLSELCEIYNFSTYEKDELMLMNKSFINQKDRPKR
jgi:thymidylate synthase